MPIDLEAEYNNRARVPEHPAIIAGWKQDAEAYRQEVGNRRAAVSYGPTARQTIDIFKPTGADATTMAILFIHGGYWQGLDPSFFSHMAKGLNTHGVTVGVAGYDLCPDVTVGDIVEQMIKAAEMLHRLTSKPIVACGHSAGGHLTACLAATEWQAINPDYPERLVKAGLAISGLFELEPLVPTTINAKLGLDIAAARAFSPRLWEPPTGMTFEAWVGGDESPEYLRQSATIDAVWRASGNETAFVALPGENHFTVIHGLADPTSALTQRLATMAKA